MVNLKEWYCFYHENEVMNNNKNARFPIETSEFHNMAGRVGRMGVNWVCYRASSLEITDQAARKIKKV